MGVRKPIVGGNWKSNPSTKEAMMELIEAFNACGFDSSKIDVVICPTMIHCGEAKQHFKASIKVAPQNCSKEKEGAFTGEVTAGMIKDCGYEWVLIGHSERRHKYGEKNEDLKKKVEFAQKSGLNTIFCIGELIEERNAGKTVDVCKEQLDAILDVVDDWSKIVIAYEPVWAIGTGVVATPEQAQEAHLQVRSYLKEKKGEEVANSVRIQYGGSVSESNCAELIALPDVDGFLVGGASLKKSFCEIISTVEKNSA